MTNTTAIAAKPGWKPWVLLAIISLIFFAITAGTFTSLGVILPFMSKSLGWSDLEAGTGFSILALMVGLSAPAPAWLLRVAGLKACFALGGGLMAGGTIALATTTGLDQYYAGTAALGLGYTFCASVPAIHWINAAFAGRRSFAIGVYMMVGGLGGVAAPFMVTLTNDLTGGWQSHWWTLAALVAVLTAAAAALIENRPDAPASWEDPAQADDGKAAQDADGGRRVYVTSHEWTLPQALRTGQYYIIVFALTLILLCGVTMNTWAFTHMTSLGITAGVAATVLSMNALVNALSRALGGSLASFIDPKWLLLSALLADVVGMLALSGIEHPAAKALFVLADGYGYGMCFFATIMLLVNYYGPKASPGAIGVMNFVTTLAVIGPTLGGYISDAMGSFAWLFRGYAMILLVFSLFVGFMRPPVPRRGEA